MAFKPTPDQLRQTVDALFAKYDKDNSYALDVPEIRELINDSYRHLKYPKVVTDEEVMKFLQKGDRNKDHRVTKVQLFDMLSKTHNA